MQTKLMLDCASSAVALLARQSKQEQKFCRSKRDATTVIAMPSAECRVQGILLFTSRAWTVLKEADDGGRPLCTADGLLPQMQQVTLKSFCYLPILTA